jgi:hypothetical protein
VKIRGLTGSFISVSAADFNPDYTVAKSVRVLSGWRRNRVSVQAEELRPRVDLEVVFG